MNAASPSRDRREARLTRRRALARGVGAAAGGALAASAGARDPAAADKNKENLDALLVSVLVLELTALTAFGRLAARPFITPPARAALEACREQDVERVRWLRGVLAYRGVAPPRGGSTRHPAGVRQATTEDAALRLAIGIEEDALGAYLTIVRVQSHHAIVRPVAAALGAHAQQLALLRDAAGLAPAPRAFEEGAAS